MPPKKLPPTEVKLSTMNEQMLQKAVEIAENAAQVAPTKNDMAAIITKNFNRLRKGTFHCIVGRDFGSYVNHEQGCFVFMYVDAFAVLLFRGKTQPPYIQQAR